MKLTLAACNQAVAHLFLCAQLRAPISRSWHVDRTDINAVVAHLLLICSYVNVDLLTAITKLSRQLGMS